MNIQPRERNHSDNAVLYSLELDDPGYDVSHNLDANAEKICFFMQRRDSRRI